MSKRDDAIILMNALGARRVPFLFIVDFEMNDPIIIPLEQVRDGNILYDINGFTNCHSVETSKVCTKFRRVAVPFEIYKLGFEQVQQELHKGNSYLLNLTFPTTLETDLRLEDFFHLSSAKYRLVVKNSFVVFSPEIFVRICDGKISCFPMKGTIDAEAKDAEARILNDPKELAEHTTIVDLIRNDLNCVAKRVYVEKFRYIDHIRTNLKNLLQVSSKITGWLPTDYPKHIGTILFSLLPAGSVTGAPKRKTVEIIKAVEPCRRGYFTGVTGYFDGSKLDSGVMIRFIEKTHAGLMYKSGGGITVYSNAENEYQEMLDKVYVPIV